MLVKQISIFVENKSGRLAEVTRILAANNINISALSIADTTDFGILRLIVDKPEVALTVLKANGLAVSCTDVIAVGIEDKPGGLADVLEVLHKAAINLEYMYAFLGKNSKDAMVILRVEDPERTVVELQKNNINLL